MNEMREDVNEMRKIVKQAQKEEQSLAMQLLQDMKIVNKRMFVLFLITILISSLEMCGIFYYVANYNENNIIESCETELEFEGNDYIENGSEVDNE